jgi:predicted ATPase/DNA-binding SARP family transcriptional activator
LNRPLERALAARLALARGTPVPDDRLARDLWGEAELTRPAERLRVLASRLRAGLGDAADALSRAAAGYALRAVPVDLVAAERAAARMHAALRAGDQRDAANAAADALSRWRDPALADLRAVPFAAAEGGRLDALWLELQVERLDADLTLGAGKELSVELVRLADDHPLHERLACLVSLGLYRAGRQADALARLAELRRALADDLGVDVAPATAAMELRLLRQDPSLDAPDTQPGRSTLPELRLATPKTTFLGRDAERAALLDQLATSTLVTLIGTAGSGKTRLALEIARVAQASNRPVVWLDLTALRGPDEVVPALMSEVGVEAGQADPVPRCAEALCGALLVVDNAEHLVEPVADLVAAVVRRADGLSVLVTTQRPLLISGEETYQVGPLPPSAASRLFCERSGAEPSPSVDAICAAVDRLPLGIELAAGLTRTLSVEQLANRLGDRLRLLVGGSRDSGRRHTSLRAALDWSHDLLDPLGRTVLRRLGVFVGGWSLEAAEQVVSGDGVTPEDVAVVLTDLVDRCLVTVAPGPRFGLLETVRHYALDRLRASGEDEAVRARHLAWGTAHVGAHDLARFADKEMQALFVEWPNLLSALDCAPGTPRAADGLRLALALDDAWMVRGISTQVMRHYEALLDADGVTDAERVEALSNFGFASTQLGWTSQATRLLDRAEPLAKAVGDDDLMMRVLYGRGISAIEDGRPVLAYDPLRRGGELAERMGRKASSSAFLCALGTAHMYAGSLGIALRTHSKANDIDRNLGDQHGLVRGLVNEAMVLLLDGTAGSALERVAEAEELARSLDDAVSFMHVRMIRGRAALLAGDDDKAIEHFRAALANAEPSSDADLVRVDLAEATLRDGQLDAAKDLLAPVLKGTPDQGLAWLVAQPTAAAVALASGDPVEAQAIAQATKAEYAERGFGWPLAMARLAKVTL